MVLCEVRIGINLAFRMVKVDEKRQFDRLRHKNGLKRKVNLW